MDLSKPRNRRTRSFWEPVYDPALRVGFAERSWALEHDTGPTRYTFCADRLAADVANSLTGLHYNGITFTECDFFGDFSKISRVITFVDCKFVRCDFGLSTWGRTKFTRCTFESTSLTQTVFRNCEFRDTQWNKVGLSGNETKLEDCVIDHAEAFIRAAWTNLDPVVLREHNTTPEYQRAKLENEKSVLSRGIMNSLQRIGTEAAFYESSRTNLRQQAWTRFWWNVHDFKRASTARAVTSAVLAIGVLMELGLINLFGFMNNWGASVLRPLMLLVAIFSAFAAAYHFGGGHPWPSAFATSFEITSVAGYTKGAALWVWPAERAVQWANLGSAVAVYTVLFATIVARICRVR